MEDQVHPVEPGKRKLRQRNAGRCYRVTAGPFAFGVYVHRRRRRQQDFVCSRAAATVPSLFESRPVDAPAASLLLDDQNFSTNFIQYENEFYELTTHAEAIENIFISD